MITRKDVPALAFFLLLSISLTECQNERSYDTNDWIPIPQPAEGKDVIQKRATGRVLTLPDSPQPKFFPEEFRNIRQAQYEQFLRETSSGNKQRPVQKQEKSQQQKPFTPQQLEQYYINQRKQLAQAQQLSERKVPQHPTLADGHVNPQLYHQSIVKQGFPNLPQEYLIPPQSVQQNYFPQQFIFPSVPDTVPTTELRQTGPVQFNNQEIKQVIQQPPSVNGTVDFYNALNLGFRNGNQQNYGPIELTTPINKDTIQLVYVPLEHLQQNNDPLPGEELPKPRQHIHHHPQNHHQSQNHNQHATHNQQASHHQQAPHQQATHQQAIHQQQQRPHHPQNHQQVRPEPQPRVPPQTYQRPQTSSFYGQQNLIKNIQNDFIQQALHAHKLQEQFEQGDFQVSTQPPTRKPVTKKRKPHQPPLAVYMTGQDNPKVTDVLYALKDAKSINVQDTVGPDSPNVFVGPANLDPPNGFSKFELPYLSSLESNRVERKVDQLPFFVAPLNYKAPPGYAKIPFPAPHVGTVVINMNDLDQNQGYIDQAQEVIPSSIRVEKIEEVSRRPVRNRGRPQYRAQPELREQTTEKVVEIQEKPREHYRGGVSTFAPHYPEPVTQQEQFNQNRYYTSVTPEQVRDYQVQNSNHKHSHAPPTTTAKTTNQHPYKFVHISPDESFAQDHNVRSSTKAPTPKQKGGIEFDIVQSVGSTLSPYDEKKHNNFFAHFENINQASNAPQVTEITPEEEYVPTVNIAQEGLQAHDVHDVYSIIPQINREKVLEQEVTKQKTRQYLPLDGQHKQQKGHVNYDHLFQLPFITNAEVNQINTAARPRHQQEEGKEQPTTGHSNIHQEKYVVFEEYPVKQNHSIQSRPQIYNERVNVGANHGKEVTESPTGNLVFPGLINDLEDQSIRQLLTPILLAPTEKTRYSTTEAPQTQPEVQHHRSSTEHVYSYSEEPSSTTSAPVTTTTQQYKLRTRGRGNSRFNDRTTTQSPRRNAGRRTQHPSRTRQTTASTTEYPDIVEYTTTTHAPRKVTTKQRFRTRGRPYISEGYSTTTSNSYTSSTTPTTTTREVVDDEYAHAVYPSTKTYTEDAVKKPQLITRAKILSPEEEYLINKYNLAYTISQDPKTDKINVEILTDRGKEDSVPESHVIQPQSTPRYEATTEKVVQEYPTPEYHAPKESDVSTIGYSRVRDYSTVRSTPRSLTTHRTVRIKTRVRGRKTTTQAPSTTERTVVVSSPAVKNDEFYGFFRSPSFRPSSSEENEGPNGRYSDSLGSSTKHETGGGDDDDGGGIKLFVNEVGSTSGPVQFVGEILPKYSTSTEQYFEVTPEEKPVTQKLVLITTTEMQTTRKKQRGRGHARKTTTQAYEESSNEVQGSNEVQHRPTQRSRTRGRAHFKSPEAATTELNQNYPQLYLSAKENQEKYTPQTSVFPDSQTEAFRITVDPQLEEQEDDQEVHSSILRPKAVLPEYNHFDDVGKQMKLVQDRDVLINGTDFRANMTDFKIIEEPEDISDTQTVTEAVSAIDEVSANGRLPANEEKKKGYWKLVKSKKVNDEFETAESQNIGVVKQNSFDDEKKPFATESYQPLITTEDDATEEQFMTVTPTNEATTLADVDDGGLEVATPQVEDATTQPTHDMLNMRNVETSTSTTIEISQKTVICTRGVCVNSPDIDMK